MKLNRLSIAEIRSNVEFGAEATPYLDGTTIPKIPNGLHQIRGCFAADVANAVKYDDPDGWRIVMDHAYIVTQ